MTEVYTCDTCEKTFKSKRTYRNHIAKKCCEYICEHCGTKFAVKSTYYYHRKTCTHNKEVNVNNNIVSSDLSTTNNNNTNNTMINDVKNNIVMLHPLGLTHAYMYKDGKLKDVIEPVKSQLLTLVKEEKYELAYLTLFNQIHGNPEVPENHNIYVKEMGSGSACVFNGKLFKNENIIKISNDMHKFLRDEMRWTVNSSDEDDKVKDQMMWNIYANWMNTSMEKSDMMERIFYNNKPVVENTFNNHKVYTNLDYIARKNNCNVEDIVYDNSIPINLP
jgi:hypothetical protein